MVIGVTDEPPSLVDAWVREHEPSYPVVSLKGDAFEEFLGVRYFPTAAVIGPEGTLLFSGSAGEVEQPLAEALDRAVREPLFPKVFRKVVAELRDGEAGASYERLLDLIEGDKLEGEEVEWGARLRTHLEQLASTAYTDAAELYRTGLVYDALRTVEPYADAKRAFPVAEAIDELVDEMERNTDFRKEVAGGKKMAEGRALEKEYEFLEAFEVYKSITKRYRGTRIAEVARARAQRLLDDGVPGWSVHCEACRASESMRACSKHAQDVKL